MLKYSEDFYSELAMEAYLQFKDVPIAEVLLMRYVDVAVAYLEEKYEGEMLRDKLEELLIEFCHITMEFNEKSEATKHVYSFLRQKLGN